MQKNKKIKFNFFNKIKQKFLIFIYSLFFVDRKNKANPFFLQTVIGSLNLILFFAFITIFIIFKNNLTTYSAIIIYILYGFFWYLYILSSLYFYYYFRQALNNKEKYYFFIALILALFGINFFISIYLYLELGVNIKQEKKLDKNVLKKTMTKSNSNNLLFTIEKKNKTNFFVLQTIIGSFNLIIFFAFITIFIIFKNNLTTYSAIITYILYGFFWCLYILFSLYFYHHYLKHMFNNKEKYYFFIALILALFGINFFISIYFYLKLSINIKENKKQVKSQQKVIKLKLNSNDIRNKTNVFILQTIIGSFNLIIFFAFITIFIIFKNNLTTYGAVITYILYGLFLYLYILFSLYFYYYFKHLFNNKEKYYFFIALILALFGINFFISIYFYLKLSINIKHEKKLDKNHVRILKFKLNSNDRNNGENIFISQTFIGIFNLLLFFALITIFIIFKNNLTTYSAIIIYILYSFFWCLYILSSLYFYHHYLKNIFSNKGKYFLFISLILALFGINLFISIYFYLKLNINIEKKKQNKKKIMSILKEPKLKLNFIDSLFVINRKNRANVFILQAIIGLFNFILFFVFISMMIIFKSNLIIYNMLIIYGLWGIYIILNGIFSLFFYFSLKSLLNINEKKYFLSSLFWAIFGINLFTSIYFYLKSGISKQQWAKALWIINKNRIKEIIELKEVKNKLNKKDLLKIKTLLKIAKNNHESDDNIHLHILKILLSKNLKWDIKIDDKEIIKLGNSL